MGTVDAPNTAIVLADNREAVLQAVSATLEKAGFTILAAASGTEALRYCRESPVPVNLAIIDLETAGINVAGLVEQLDTVSPGMRILFLAGDEDEKFLRGVATSGRNRGFLQKPFRRAQLLGQVLELAARPLVLTA